MHGALHRGGGGVTWVNGEVDGHADAVLQRRGQGVGPGCEVSQCVCVASRWRVLPQLQLLGVGHEQRRCTEPGNGPSGLDLRACVYSAGRGERGCGCSVPQLTLRPGNGQGACIQGELRVPGEQRLQSDADLVADWSSAAGLLLTVDRATGDGRTGVVELLR